MIRPTPLWRSVAVLGVAGLALTACGGSSDSTSTTEKSSDAASSSAPAAAKGDGTLKIGTLLPQTGSLAFLGPPEFAGVDLALSDINDAGGVNGKQVEKVDSDSGDTSTDTASQSVDRLLSNNVDAIVGAASSSVSLSVIDKITGAGRARDLAGEHLRRAHVVRRQGSVLPYRAAGRPPGPGRRRQHPRRRQQHPRHHGAAGLLRHRARQVGDRVVHRWRRPGRRAGHLRPQGRVVQHRGRQDQGCRPRGDHPDRVRRDQEDHP